MGKRGGARKNGGIWKYLVVQTYLKSGWQFQLFCLRSHDKEKHEILTLEQLEPYSHLKKKWSELSASAWLHFFRYVDKMAAVECVKCALLHTQRFLPL